MNRKQLSWIGDALFEVVIRELMLNAANTAHYATLSCLKSNCAMREMAIRAGFCSNKVTCKRGGTELEYRLGLLYQDFGFAATRRFILNLMIASQVIPSEVELPSTEKICEMDVSVGLTSVQTHCSMCGVMLNATCVVHRFALGNSYYTTHLCSNECLKREYDNIQRDNPAQPSRTEPGG